VECVSQSQGRPMSAATKNGLRSTRGDPFGPPVGVVRGWWEACPASVIPCVTPCVGAWRVVRFSFIDARGVAHWRTVASVRVSPCVPVPLGLPPDLRLSIPVGVGHEPEPLPAVRGTNVGR